jgi:lipid-A-disaccharide synthase
MKYYYSRRHQAIYGSNLMKALEDVNANIRFWGGDLMQKAGGTLVKHYRELAFMGFVEVLFNLKTILGNIKICKMIAEFKPDVIIFIDYPGFNMRIAKWAEKSIPTHYYISPQIWAWKIASLTSKDVDKCYLPFEKHFMKTNIIFRSSLWVTL